MSIISIVYVPEGIVIAADSRLTWKKEYKDKDGNNRLLVQYSEMYGVDACVNIMHRWITVQK